MRLRVLGCSGTYPTPWSPSSGYVIEDATASVWLDCGTGTFAALQQVRDYTSIDALVLSHLHSDHCLDIYPLYYALRFNPEARRLPVYCPSGTEDQLAQLLVGDTACKLNYIFDFRYVKPGETVEVGDVRLDFAITDHPVPTHAVRAESPEGILTYSADTGPGMDLDVFARDSDVLLCEASYQNNDCGAPLHLTAEQAGEYAKRASTRDLVLTHFWPTHDHATSRDEARAAAGDVPVHLAHPGGVYDIETRTWTDPGEETDAVA